MNYHFCKNSQFKLGLYKTLNQVCIIIGKVLRYQLELSALGELKTKNEQCVYM